MRREYHGYFAVQFRNLRRPHGGRLDGIEYLPDLIDSLCAKIPSHWRSDARFFLANNMLEMVALPYDAIDGPDGALAADGSVGQLIVKDWDMLIETSNQVAKERDRGYVSATSVAIALGRAAANLATTSLQIWGPDG